MNKLFQPFLATSRTNKRLISLGYDLLSIPLAIIISFSLRIGVAPYELSINSGLIWAMAATTLASIILFVKFGLYRAIVRFMTEEAYVRIGAALLISSMVLASSSFLLNASMPRSIPIIYFFIAFALIGLPRFFIRSIVTQLDNSNRTPVAIYGAGIQGMQLAQTLRKSDQFKAVLFVDDCKQKAGNNIHGLNVVHPQQLAQRIEKLGIKKVLLALGNTSKSKRKEIISALTHIANIEVLTTPSVQDIISGKAKIEELAKIDVEDLLGRDPVPPNKSLLDKSIRDKVVLVTGAGGSIGSEICRQALKQQPKQLILLELNEFGLYRIEQELNIYATNNGIDTQIISLLGSVQKQNRLETIFKTFGVQTVYHAAAYKHVPMVEHNVVEGVRNNVFGTWYTAEAAVKAGVERFVLISTDKAVRPTNVMGASKRMAELVLQALAKRQNDTTFCMVRFGNVLGSSGSVVPLFKRQLEQGGPITLTHKDITRYFMTIPEASQLVIQAGAMGKGGDVFVLEMGEPVKIYELAQKMISLTGLTQKTEQTPNGDIEIKITGLRPGEKLYEELLVGDNVEGTEHPRIMTANEVHLTWPETHNLLNRLDKACHNFEVQDVIDLLLEAPAAYTRNTEENPDWVLNRSKH